MKPSQTKLNHSKPNWTEQKDRKVAKPKRTIYFTAIIINTHTEESGGWESEYSVDVGIPMEAVSRLE